MILPLRPYTVSPARLQPCFGVKRWNLQPCLDMTTAQLEARITFVTPYDAENFSENTRHYRYPGKRIFVCMPPEILTYRERVLLAAVSDLYNEDSNGQRGVEPALFLWRKHPDVEDLSENDRYDWQITSTRSEEKTLFTGDLEVLSRAMGSILDDFKKTRTTDFAVLKQEFPDLLRSLS